MNKKKPTYSKKKNDVKLEDYVINPNTAEGRDAKREVVEFFRKELLNGKSKYEILKAVEEGKYAKKYPYANGKKRTTINQWLQEAYDLCAIENAEQINKQRDLVYERFMELYRQALDRGDVKTAKSVLDSISKLLGLNEAESLDKATHTAITVKLV